MGNNKKQANIEKGDFFLFNKSYNFSFEEDSLLDDSDPRSSPGRTMLFPWLSCSTLSDISNSNPCFRLEETKELLEDIVNPLNGACPVKTLNLDSLTETTPLLVPGCV